MLTEALFTLGMLKLTSRIVIGVWRGRIQLEKQCRRNKDDSNPEDSTEGDGPDDEDLDDGQMGVILAPNRRDGAHGDVIQEPSQKVLRFTQRHQEHRPRGLCTVPDGFRRVRGRGSERGLGGGDTTCDDSTRHKTLRAMDGASTGWTGKGGLSVGLKKESSNAKLMERARVRSVGSCGRGDGWS